MPKHWSELPSDVLALLRRGTVIPAHPLALDSQRRLDPGKVRFEALRRNKVRDVHLPVDDPHLRHPQLDRRGRFLR